MYSFNYCPVATDWSRDCNNYFSVYRYLKRAQDNRSLCTVGSFPSYTSMTLHFNEKILLFLRLLHDKGKFKKELVMQGVHIWIHPDLTDGWSCSPLPGRSSSYMIAVTFSINLSSICLSCCWIWALAWPYPVTFPGMGASDSHIKFNFFLQTKPDPCRYFCTYEFSLKKGNYFQETFPWDTSFK